MRGLALVISASEFSGPTGYSDQWKWLALGGVVVIALYYAAALWWTRPGRPAPVRKPERPDVPAQRRLHLARLDEIEADLLQHRIDARVAHQRLSATVRSYAGSVSSLKALQLTLAELRGSGPAPLADAIETMYPPEFAPTDEGQAEPRFDDAMRQARRLVASWS